MKLFIGKARVLSSGSTKPLIAVVGLLTLLGCSTGKEKDRQNRDAAEQSQTADAKPEQAPPSPQETPSVEGNQGANLTGIPASCRTLDQAADAKFCFECKPRALEVQHCFESKGIADISKSCTHDAESVVCKDDEGKELKFSVKPNQVEQTLESMPFVILAARALLASKLKDKPKELEMVNSALDILDKHSVDIFRGDKSVTVADALSAAIAKHKANLTKEQTDALHAAIVKALTELGATLKTGKVDLSNISKTATDILAALPFDKIGGGSTALDLNKLREAFAGGQTTGLSGLATLVKTMNLGSLEDILKKMLPISTPPATTNTETP
jgi:dsDNA-binding SOS-regulon protein